MHTPTPGQIRKMLLVSVLVLVTTSASAQEAWFRLTAIGTFRSDNTGRSWANDVNDSGQVVGSAYIDDSFRHAYVWDPTIGEKIDLGTFREENAGYSDANAINESGQIVGTASIETSVYQHAALWDLGAGTMTDLGTLNPDTTLGSRATGINDQGYVVGVWTAPTELDPTNNGRGFFWDPNSGTMTDIGTLADDGIGWNTPTDINAAGIVVGYTNNDDSLYNSRAFRWDSDTEEMIDLGTLLADNSGTAHAYGINSAGYIVGSASSSPYNLDRAFIWNPDTQEMTTLGSLVTSGTTSGAAFGINSAGHVVGYESLVIGSRAFFWYRGVLYNLNDLIDPSDPLAGAITLWFAYGISDSDQIAALGKGATTDGQDQAFLLTPTPLCLVTFLHDDVLDLDLPRSISKTTDRLLQEAEDVLSAANPGASVAAIGLLQAFINLIEAKSDKVIVTSQVDSLMAKAQAIVEALSGE